MREGTVKRSKAGWLLAVGCAALVACWFPCAGASEAVTNGTSPADPVMARAAEAERAGRLEEAADAYEALLVKDRAFEAVVAPRLVTLHVQLGQAPQALSWAMRVAQHHPEPAAYLAGIHAQIGQFKEAELALREALRQAADPERRIPLLWQLADMQEALGDAEAARVSLVQAHDLAPTGARRETALERLRAHRHRQTDEAPEPAEGAPGGEVTP